MGKRTLTSLLGLLLAVGGLVAGTAPAQAADPFRLPFAGTYKVTQGRHQSSTGAVTAWDLAPINGASSDVYAPGDGTVKIASFCGPSNVSATLQLTSGGQTFVLSHLSRSSVVAAGIGATAVSVARGQRLGSLWQGTLNEYPCESSSGTHLHFEVQICPPRLTESPSRRPGLRLVPSSPAPLLAPHFLHLRRGRLSSRTQGWFTGWLAGLRCTCLVGMPSAARSLPRRSLTRSSRLFGGIQRTAPL